MPWTRWASRIACAGVIAGCPSPECVINGNVNWKGERIYHIPGQRDYARIYMADPSKRWFCSEEAEAAGWRRTARR